MVGINKDYIIVTRSTTWGFSIFITSVKCELESCQFWHRSGKRSRSMIAWQWWTLILNFYISNIIYFTSSIIMPYRKTSSTRNLQAAWFSVYQKSGRIHVFLGYKTYQWKRWNFCCILCVAVTEQSNNIIRHAQIIISLDVQYNTRLEKNDLSNIVHLVYLNWKHTKS